MSMESHHPDNKSDANEIETTAPHRSSATPTRDPSRHRRLADLPDIAFAVEFGDDKNRSISINALTTRVRGRYSNANLHANADGVGGRDVGRAMAGMPDIPGIRLRIDVGEQYYELHDPLSDNPKLMARIAHQITEARLQGVAGTEPVESIVNEMDVDQLKTLLLEIWRKVNQTNQAVVVEGTLPDIDEINELPGNELYDPWNQTTHKPTYVKDVARYESQIADR